MLTPLLAALTFPGVVIHEWAHKAACDLLGVPVFEVVYLRFGNPLGYVRHAEVINPVVHALIAAAPILFSSLVALGFGLVGCSLARCRWAGAWRWWMVGVVLWVAWSAGFHAFPSGGDADALLLQAARGRFYYEKIILLPASWLIRLGNLLAFRGFDILYATTLALLVPVITIWGLGLRRGHRRERNELSAI